jgi:hypothetical protein
MGDSLCRIFVANSRNFEILRKFGISLDGFSKWRRFSKWLKN